MTPNFGERVNMQGGRNNDRCGKFDRWLAAFTYCFQDSFGVSLLHVLVSFQLRNVPFYFKSGTNQ